MNRTYCVFRSLWVAVFGVAAFFGRSLPVAAQTATAATPDAPANAEQLDQQGMQLLKQGKIAEACAMFAESFRARSGTGVLMRLALCQEQSGKTASAWRSYLDAAVLAAKSGDAAVAQLAHKRAAALEVRLARVTLQLDQSAKEAYPFEVSCDGQPVPSTELGSPLVLDPGLHVVSATAPGRMRFVETLSVGENTASSLTISLPVLARDSAPISDPTPHHQPAIDWTVQRTAAVVSGGVGVAGLAIGTIFGLRVASKMSDARERCGGVSSGCPPESLALQDQARGSAHVATAAFTVGAVGISGGVILWLMAPKGERVRSETGLSVSPVLGQNNGGFAMSGRW